MNDAVRVRYAPSPTGIPHVGNIRTALFNWLFARSQGGSFIVRIEDTDQARLVPGATQAIMESLRWLGIDWDEGPIGEGMESRGGSGPYFQSLRKDLYRDAARQMIERGHAYTCYCTPERLDEVRKQQQERKLPPKYDLHCRNLPEDERRRLEDANVPRVVRFAVPPSGSTSFNDLIRGEITFENANLDDFVLLKSDGFPTYHLANIVDDHLMKISHVMRADEWVSSTPKHVLLYRAMGWQPPLFAHLPMILGPDRSKLSKRHGATSLLEYRDQGFLPEAMMNFLALLGWSLDDHTEIISREELTRHFSIDRIGKTAAIFNREKLEWMNGMYIRSMPAEEVARRMLPFLERDLPRAIRRPIAGDYLARIVPLIHDRLKLLSEAAPLTDFFFADALVYDPALIVQKGMDRAGSLRALESADAALQQGVAWDAPTLENTIRPMAEALGLKTGQLFGTLRVAVTGRAVAPPLFETMAVLGRDRCLRRVGSAIAVLKQ